ncbi:MFS transporter [Arthrobacter sp. ISL-28]|uniref:MFS transporter n=1 Tax=Arthrobacter sp. ISL-28 TaxID=2819108 RepID=UPI001BECFF82|nr:MFS transporter [Arthrobacter sp. ISL-28]MBT2521751.1 MFS transporter [Arthrobacter sp. ISL-28]
MSEPVAPGAPQPPVTSDSAVGTATAMLQAMPVSRAGVFRYGIGFVVFGFLWIAGLMVVAAVVLPQQLTDLGVENPAGLLGAVNAFGTAFALVSNFVWGNLSDRTRSRLGRRTPWILAGTALSGLSLASLGWLHEPVAIIAAFCVFQVSLNMLLAPAVAVLSDRVPQSARGTVSAAYGTGVAVGVSVGVLIGALFISNLTAGFLVGGGLVLISGVVAVILWPREPSARDLPATSRNLKDVLISMAPPRKAPDFYWAFGSRFFMLISYQMIMAYQLYIIQDYVGQTKEQSAATIATMAIITLVASLIGSTVSGPISDLIKRRKLPVILSSLLFAVGIAMPWIMPNTMGLYLFAGIAGLGYGIYMSVDQALLVDVLPDKEKAGKDLAILNMSTTAGQTVGPIVTSIVVTATGAYALAFPVSIAAAVVGLLLVTKIRGVR